MDLEEWRTKELCLLNELIKYRDIERDNFDFKSKDIVFGKKGDKERLEHHLCAMANTITGILCLGIDDPVSHTNPNFTFRPNGFRKDAKGDILKIDKEL